MGPAEVTIVDLYPVSCQACALFFEIISTRFSHGTSAPAISNENRGWLPRYLPGRPPAALRTLP